MSESECYAGRGEEAVVDLATGLQPPPATHSLGRLSPSALATKGSKPAPRNRHSDSNGREKRAIIRGCLATNPSHPAAQGTA